MVWAKGGGGCASKGEGRGDWIGDGNGDIGGQVLVFPTAATKRHRSMGKHRRTPCSPIFHFHRSIVPLFHHSSQSLRITNLLHPPFRHSCVCVCAREKIVHLFFSSVFSSNSTRLRSVPREFSDR